MRTSFSPRSVARATAASSSPTRRTWPSEPAAYGANFRTVITPPLMHGAAQWGACNAFSGFLGGATIILYVEHSFDAARVWDLAEREKATGLNVVGDAMARPLVEELEADAGRRDLTAFTSFGSGGAVLSPGLKDRVKAALPNVTVSDGFGASETGAGGTPAGNTATRPRFRLSEGVTVLDDDLKPVVPGSGVIGRLARSGHIPLGYYKDEAKTAATFVTARTAGGTWFPGDFATVEDDGLITLLGRGSQCINTGGEKVYPEEVETVVREHAADHRCAGGRSARRAFRRAGERRRRTAPRCRTRPRRTAGALPRQARRLQGAAPPGDR